MLILETKDTELFDEKESRFISQKGRKVAFEHSLISVSKWESKWKKPFLSNKEKTREETVDYFRCMCLTSGLDNDFFYTLDQDSINRINEYINDNMTATTITRRGPKKASREIITSEIIYYWMIQNGVPMECEKWHLNRLLTLIEVCSVKSGPQKKMSRQEQLAQQRALNASRLAKLNTRG